MDNKLVLTGYVNYVKVTGSPTARIKLSEALAYKRQGYQYSNAYQTKVWDGKIKLMKYNKPVVYGKKMWFFPAGLLMGAVDFLDKNKIPYHYVLGEKFDARKSKRVRKAKKLLDKNILKDIVLHDYEVDAIKEALRNVNGILEVPTAGGKSLIAAAIIKSLNVTSLFLTHKKSYLRDMGELLTSQFNEGVVGQVGGGIAHPSIVDVASIQTIYRNLTKLRKYLDSKRLIIVDECHFACSNSYFKVLENCRHATWKYGLTASIETKPIRMVGECYLGKTIYSISPSKLIRKNYITPPKVVMIPIDKKTIPERILYSEVYRMGITENSYRNRYIAKVTKLLLKKKRFPIVILCRLLHHQKLIAKTLHDNDIEFVSCNGESTNTNDVFEDVKLGKINVCLFSGIFDESTNIPNLKSLILTGGGYSTKKTIQRLGRGMRIFKRKKYFVVVDFFDRTNGYLYSHSQRRMKSYKRLGYTADVSTSVSECLEMWDKNVKLLSV